MSLKIQWVLESPTEESPEEYSTDIAGYSCYVGQFPPGAGHKEWGWTIYLKMPEGAGDVEFPELTSGETDTLAKAMLSAVKEVRKITRHTLRELKLLHGAKTVDMKVVPSRKGH